MIPRPGSSRADDRIVSLKDVKFSYEGTIQALSGVSLDLRKGDYAAIVGGNGSGKTTLAKVMNGLLTPDSGTVMVQGRPTTDRTVAELARVVGYAFQNPDHQLFRSSVEDEVRFGPLNFGFNEEIVKEKAARAMDAMGISKIGSEPPLSLTLGERRRISIASVVAMDTDVLILDEPTTGLDARESEDLMASIDGLNREGRTIVLITHDMRLVARHAKRVIVMAQGRILLDTDPKGAFSDLDVLRRSNLVPPPVVLLAHRLSEQGIPGQILSPEELVFLVMRERGERI